MLILKAEKRDSGEKKSGYMPAVFYGAKEKSTSVSVLKSDFKKVWGQAGESSIVTLETPKSKLNALIYDVQMDPVLNEPIHADFYIVEAGKEIETTVPIEFEGTAPAVKELGGILIKVLHEVEISVLPENLPHNLSVNLASLKEIGDHILVGDIKLPDGVSLKTDIADTIVSVSEAQEEEEEVAPEEVDLSSIEVEKKGKAEEEEEGGDKGEKE